MNTAALRLEPTTPFGTHIPIHYSGSTAVNYDEGLGPNLYEDYARQLAQRAAAIQPTRVLEIAAGTGILSRKLRDVLPVDVELVITDIDHSMLSRARKKFRNGENVFFDQFDAKRIGFPPGSFDMVVCQFGVMYFMDKPNTFAEIRRVLGPGGTFLFNSWGNIAQNPFAKISQEAIDRYMPPHAPSNFFDLPFSYDEPYKVSADMQAGGFGNNDYEVQDIQKHVSDFGLLARGLVQGTGIGDEIRARGDVLESDVIAQIKLDLQSVFPNGVMPLRAILYEGWT